MATREESMVAQVGKIPDLTVKHDAEHGALGQMMPNGASWRLSSTVRYTFGHDIDINGSLQRHVWFNFLIQ